MADRYAGNPNKDHDPFDAIRWIEVWNADTVDLPGGCLLSVKEYAQADDADGVDAGVAKVTRPTAASQGPLLTNDQVILGQEEYGQAHAQFPASVLFEVNDGIPAVGDEWGSKGNDPKLRKGYAGYRIQETPQATAEYVVVVAIATDRLQFVIHSQTDDLLRCVPWVPPTDDDGNLIPQLYDPSLWAAPILDEDGNPIEGEDGLLLRDETTEADVAVYVAKPYDLQQTPWDGRIVALDNLGTSYLYARTGHSARTATDQNTSLVGNQVVGPDYFPGDVILCSRASTGYQNPDDDSKVAWMDENTAGRAWIELCP